MGPVQDCELTHVTLADACAPYNADSVFCNRMLHAAILYDTPAIQGFAWQSQAPRRSQHPWAMTWQVRSSPNHTALSQTLLGRGLSCDRAKLHLQGPRWHILQASMLIDHMLPHTVGTHLLPGSNCQAGLQCTACMLCSLMQQRACCFHRQRTEKQHMVDDILCRQRVHAHNLQALLGEVHTKTDILVFAQNLMLSWHESIYMDDFLARDLAKERQAQQNKYAKFVAFADKWPVRSCHAVPPGSCKVQGTAPQCMSER